MPRFFFAGHPEWRKQRAATLSSRFLVVLSIDRAARVAAAGDLIGEATIAARRRTALMHLDNLDVSDFKTLNNPNIG